MMYHIFFFVWNQINMKGIFFFLKFSILDNCVLNDLVYCATTKNWSFYAYFALKKLSPPKNKLMFFFSQIFRFSEYIIAHYILKTLIV